MRLVRWRRVGYLLGTFVTVAAVLAAIPLVPRIGERRELGRAHDLADPLLADAGAGAVRSDRTLTRTPCGADEVRTHRVALPRMVRGMTLADTSLTTSMLSPVAIAPGAKDRHRTPAGEQHLFAGNGRRRAVPQWTPTDPAGPTGTAATAVAHSVVGARRACLR
jgi:hypothetical protein